MIATSCKLISSTTSYDSIGTPIQTKTENEIPIIKQEDIRANEFYQAETNGHKITLRLRISSLNYNGEQELNYMGTDYTIVRTQNLTYDEIVLICERKMNNGK